jgi:hypothetical protein
MVGSLPYQLIHRTASVCCVDAPARWVVYQIFGDHRGNYYHDQLSEFKQLLPERAPLGLGVLECGLSRRSLQASTAPSALVAEMKTTGLFGFAEPSFTLVRRIG